MIVAAAAAAAATDRPNRSSSDSSQERRRRGSGGGQLRASEPPIVRLMTQCLGGCALTYASARGVRTHTVNESLNTRTQQKQQQHNDYSQAAADRPNSCSSSTQQRRGRGGGQLRASEPPFVRLMTPCLGCALFGSVTCSVPVGYVLPRMLCVVCWLLSCMCCSVFFLLLLENTYVVKNSVKIKSTIVVFARKRYTVTVNGISVSPSWFCCVLYS